MIRMMLASAAAVMILGASTPAGADGKETFAKNCVNCHGADGKAKTKMGEKLQIKDLTDAKVQASFTDDKAIKDITEGTKDEKTGKVLMPAKKDKLTADQIKEVVTFVRTLKGT